MSKDFTKLDFDNQCGFWLYNRPYVWIEGENMEKSERLYLVYDYDRVFYFPKWQGKWPHERRAPFKNINRRDRDSMCMIDVWGKRPWGSCKWVINYFRVYRSTKDGELETLDVRRNGEPYHPSGPKTVENYLKKAGKYPKDKGMKLDTDIDFILRPRWSPTIFE